MIRTLTNAEINGEKLCDYEIASFLRLLVVGGAETTKHLLGSAFYAMLHDPELMARVRNDRQFTHPDKFDIDRKDNEQFSFGYGRRLCTGSHLAKLKAEIAVNALPYRLVDITLAPGKPCNVIGFSFRGPDSIPVTFRAS